MFFIGTHGSAHPTKVATELPGPPTPHVVAHGALMRRQDTTQLEAAVSCLLNCICTMYSLHDLWVVVS